jgi:hypothetical protein
MATKKSSSIEAPKPDVGFAEKCKAELDRIIKRDGKDRGIHAQIEALEIVLSEWYAAWAKGDK